MVGRTVEQTMTEITAMGINVVRLPIAPQTLDASDPQGIGDIRTGGVLKNHESVRQTAARQAMEDFIVLAEQNIFDIIIDIHSCSNYVGWRAGRLDATPPWVDVDREGYDFTREEYSCGSAGAGVTVHEYDETIWLDNLREIAGLSEQLGVNNIVGVDIFNEPWNYTWQE
ncbi:MAG: endoglucanase [Arenicella sp.]